MATCLISGPRRRSTPPPPPLKKKSTRKQAIAIWPERSLQPQAILNKILRVTTIWGSQPGLRVTANIHSVYGIDDTDLKDLNHWVIRRKKLDLMPRYMYYVTSCISAEPALAVNPPLRSAGLFCTRAFFQLQIEYNSQYKTQYSFI